MLAKGSLPIIAVPLVLTVLFVLLSIYPCAVSFLILTVLFAVFFRDPNRRIAGGIVAPADGRISSIQNFKDRVKITTIMSLANVHVNRAPLEGKVVSMEHLDGKHIPAFSKDSERNERLITTLETDIGEVRVVQIAGFFARRIVPYTEEGEMLSKGQRMGLIRFGSRVDLEIPRKGLRIMVRNGFRVKAGESSLALEVQHEN